MTSDSPSPPAQWPGDYSPCPVVPPPMTKALYDYQMNETMFRGDKTRRELFVVMNGKASTHCVFRGAFAIEGSHYLADTPNKLAWIHK